MVRRNADGRVPWGLNLNLTKLLNAFEREHHIQVACRFLAKGNQRLIFRRVVPGVERIHVREFDDNDALRFPVASLGHFVAAALGQVASAMLGDHRPDLDPVFLEFGGVGDDMLNDQVGCHVKSPGAISDRAKIIARHSLPTVPRGLKAESAPLMYPVIGWRNIPASLWCLNTPSGVLRHASPPQIPLYRSLVRRRAAARTASVIRAACRGSALRTVREGRRHGTVRPGPGFRKSAIRA